MSYKRIIVAVENFAQSEAVIEQLVNHRWPPGAAFKILCIIDPSTLNATGFGANEHALRDAKASATTLINHVLEKTKQAFPDADVEGVVCQGQPTSMLLQEASDWPADLVIVGSHGRDVVARAFKGSVSLSVLVQAPCAVLVVRPAKRAPGRRIAVSSAASGKTATK